MGATTYVLLSFVCVHLEILKHGLMDTPSHCACSYCTFLILPTPYDETNRTGYCEEVSSLYVDADLGRGSSHGWLVVMGLHLPRGLIFRQPFLVVFPVVPQSTQIQRWRPLRWQLLPIEKSSRSPYTLDPSAGATLFQSGQGFSLFSNESEFLRFSPPTEGAVLPSRPKLSTTPAAKRKITMRNRPFWCIRCKIFRPCPA